VTWSTRWDADHVNYKLDYTATDPGSWCAKFNDKNQWIQVSSGGYPVSWTSIITQGRPQPQHNQFVTSYKVSYSLDGRRW
jgi:hypothetical protein